MKLGKKIIMLGFIGTMSLFAAGVNDISLLVNKINNTENLETRGELLKELDKELSSLDKKDLPAAQEIVSNKLQLSKVLEK
ncbi:hypothetical protein [Arcobacter sp.]|uniref:hypothetical protein n=1 Tax=Arcobacter sp. TaxID=1872629 RepID=UPI003D0F3911